MSHSEVTLVDQNQIKFNMAVTALLLAFAYLINSWIPVAIAVVCQFAGAAGSSLSPYLFMYKNLLLPTGLVKPHSIPDNHAPHRFAALVGGLFNVIGIIFLLGNNYTFGWIFVAIVFVLSNLNLWISFCAGCFMYYIFNRIGVPGFNMSPIISTED